MRQKLTLLYILLVILFSCKKESDYKKVDKKINISNTDFLNSYGIYSLKENELITEESFLDLAKKMLPNFQHYTTRNERRTTLGYYFETIDSLQGVLTPPDPSYLLGYGRGISSEQQELLKNATKMAGFTFYGPKEKAKEAQRKINEMMLAVSLEGNYIIVDFGTLEYFSSTAWKRRRLDNYNQQPYNVMDQILIKVLDTPEGNCRAVTFGMEKFCLPDISISNLDCANPNKYTDLLLAVSQSISERPEITADSTITINVEKIKNPRWKSYFSKITIPNQKDMTIKLTKIQPKYGDKNNTQFEILSGDPETSLTTLTSKLFNDASTLGFVTQGDELLKASKEARKKLPLLKKKFNAQQLKENFLLLKAPFLNDYKKKEWMWVEIVEWNDSEIRGKLYNESPNMSNLKKGIMVSINESDVFDYITKNEDGSIDGNETENYIKPSKK